eukprot:jgi/Hompol1/6588/HPOL_000454-RA
MRITEAPAPAPAPGSASSSPSEQQPASASANSRFAGAANYALVNDEPLKTRFVKELLSTHEIRLRFGPGKRNSLALFASPFRFEFAVDGVPAISFNERGYFYLERLRTKGDRSAEPAVASKIPESPENPLTERSIEIDNLRDRLVSNLWEEDFAAKTDSKPRGPSSFGLDISFPGSSNGYGLPEHASGFSLKTTRGKDAEYTDPYRLYNLDVFEYELDNPMALYGSVPFMMSHKPGLSAAVLLLNGAEMWVDIEKTKGSGSKLQMSNYEPFSTKQTSATSVETHWIAESGLVDLFFFLGPTQADIFNSYTDLTGRPVMPQQFAVAYHQCRWNYNTEDDVKAVDAGFDEHDIPYDVLWLDIEHTNGKRYFTWDSAKFPSPMKMQENIALRKRKMVTIIDPHIKKDLDFFVSKQALDKGIFVKNDKGEVFDGHCWPGESNWIDYFNPAGRAFWSSKFAYSEYKGSTPILYTWNDMNEPSVFNGPEITMPKDNLHHGGIEHRDVHNIYGMLFHQSTFEGHLLRSEGKDRPFVLSRAFFAGTQRYGAIWTGDNFAKWDHLAASVPMLLSIGISGIPFAGADVGGFFGNPSVELLTRWYQVGSLQPFFRAHAHIDTKRREPWLFGEPYTSIIRDSVRRRYKLLPYIYSLFSEASRSGVPVMRPMMYEFPQDEATFAMDDQFLLGSAILVKPVVAIDQTSVDVYLPKASVWYEYETFNRVTADAAAILKYNTESLATVPIFLRGGSIVPRRDRVRRSSAMMRADPYTLVVALDKNGAAAGSLYVDDGATFAFQDGEYIYTTFTFENGRLTAAPSRLASVSNNPVSQPVFDKLSQRVERIVFVGLTSAPKTITAGGQPADFTVDKRAADNFVVTVKNPMIAVGREWTVSLS